MSKEVRIFCADLLTQIEECVPTQTIVQMMQKESMFKQKFVQIGGPPSTLSGGSMASSAPMSVPTSLGAKASTMQQSNTLMGQMKLAKPSTSTSLMSGAPMTLSKLKEQ
jgi:hypothetical protein